MIRSNIDIALLVTLSMLLARESNAAPSEIRRYPFDPVCAWGRVADGRGLILRCLSKDESERLARTTTSTQGSGPVSGATGQQHTNTAGVQPNPKPAVTTPELPVGQTPTNHGTLGPDANAPPSSATTPASSPTGSGEKTDAEAPTPVPLLSKEMFAAELVRVVADEGELPLATKKLAQPADRYAKCVADFGGLSATVGQVEVRFLVRERGRAEGASVGKFVGITEAAASCIAQVVDRRPTGVPAAPVVGATATISIQKRPARPPLPPRSKGSQR